MDWILNTIEARQGMLRVLSEVSNLGLERLLGLIFEELKGRSVHYGLDGPYPAWDPEWGMDSVGLLEARGRQKDYTIHPTPNPPLLHSKPPSSVPAVTEQNQSRRV